MLVKATTAHVDSQRHVALNKDHLVELCMEGVQANSLPSGYDGDALAGLEFHRDGAHIRMDFESHTDRDGQVLCREVLVKSVLPYETSPM